MRENKLHRERASIVVLDKEKKRFLVMYRKINNVEKYVLLGGGVEPNESIEDAAVREVAEEAGIKVSIDKKLTDIKYKTCTDHVFLSTSYSGEIKLGGEEIERSSKVNVYSPTWISTDSLKDMKIPIYPKFIVKLILKELCA